VHEGTAIEVAMLTAVSSDLPGPCRAQVVRDVFDSATGSVRVIPAGARLICTYNAEVVQGQDKVFMAFTRLIYPSGASVALTAFEGADGVGAIGGPAEVNTRFWRVFGSSLLIAAVTHLAERDRSSNGSAGTTINVNTAASNVAASALADTAKASLQRNLNIKPELRLRPGDHLRVVVNRDMVLPPHITGTGALQ
jgi:type IV secretory pathway VirB10-like protein